MVLYPLLSIFYPYLTLKITKTYENTFLKICLRHNGTTQYGSSWENASLANWSHLATG